MAESHNDGDMLNEDDMKFAQLNERARMLAERALYHDDSDATRELQMMFSPLILRMRNSVERRLQADLVSTLTLTTMRALKQAIDKRKDRPLAYTLQALRNEYIRFGTREDRRKFEKPFPEGFDPPDPRNGDVYDHRSAVLRKINEYRDQARATGRRKIDLLLAEVIMVCYLMELNPPQAYDLLGLTPRERASLSERISREKRNPDSLLNRLGDDIRRIAGGLFDDETPARGQAATGGTDHLTRESEDGATS